MAEETDHSPERQKISEGGEDNSSDNTVVKLHTPNNKVPHYLRASTGSCHDACKYGKPHEFKNKPWKPMRKRVSAPPPDTEKAEEIQIFVDRKVKDALEADKPGPSQHTPLPVDEIKKNIPSARNSPAPNYSRPIKQERRPFTKSPSPDAPKVINKVIQSCGKSPSPDNLKPVKRASSVPKGESSFPKRDVLTKRASSNAKERNASAVLLKSNSSTMKPSSSADSSIGSGGKRSSKPSCVNDPRTSRVSVKKDMTRPAAVLSSKKTSKVEIKRTWNSSVTGSSCVPPGVKTGSSSLRKNENPRDLIQRSRTSRKTQIITNKTEPKEPIDETVEEKTLHMIETREDCLPNSQGSFFIQSPSPLSPESLNSSSQANSQSFTSHEVHDEQDLGSEYTDSETHGSVVDSSKEEKDEVGHGGNLDSGDWDPATMKLKFRRGKIIDPKAQTNSSRRLRFREGKSAGDDQGSNGGHRRSYRRRAVDGDKKESETGAVKVVLKHQEIEEKKDMQILLNNVIEETASKLVATRKSKVQALVGAFETVISLQESKPPPPPAATATSNHR